MEDGSDDIASSAVTPPPINDAEAEEMANFPVAEDSACGPPKVNGDPSSPLEAAPTAENDEKDSSDCDALVIDESVKPVVKRKSKGASNADDAFRHTNPYFSESIFELSTQYNSKPQDGTENVLKVRKFGKGGIKKFRGKNGKPKLREYAQYLGLQPRVQFKCSKCLSSGFPSFPALNEHLLICTSSAQEHPPAPLSNNATNFRVTRKVFLCSACGTYYENWNLFLHMREVHKRFICLYCLGMFSHAEKLSLHLVAKHNCSPVRFDTTTDFFKTYRDPCFLMCCDCQTVFNEQENFIAHGCVDGTPPPVEADAEKIGDAVEPDVRNDAGSIPEVDDNSATVEADCVENKPRNNSDTQPDTETVETCKTSDESLMSGKEVTVDRQQDSVNSGDCGDNRESDCNSEINMIENESAAENSNSADDKTLEKEDTVLESGHNTDDNMNNDSIDYREDVTEDSDDNKFNDDDDIDMEQPESRSNTPDVRRVPKVTLKLPKMAQYKFTDEEDYQSDDSEKLTMEVERDGSDVDIMNEHLENENCEDVEDGGNEDSKNETAVPTAGIDIAILELELEQPLDKFDVKLLLQKCLGATIATCLYCNHARKIAVNGKQLGLHAIAEHRYSAIVKSITAEELIPESFNVRIKEGLSELEDVYFNLESTSSEGGITFSHIFECFQCRYSTTVHKELYLHNRKMHAKAVLLCIMCKTSFYSYCELICHLCPGIYAPDGDVRFRCCLCVGDDLSSAFRLMVHLRKKHHVCDVCLEMCHDQSRLSNHVWKHKLHHLCYRCGIAYRNKPDITKHLYWKHGTESVLCKKCLQKKWPHVYHFCIPPTSFPCEECSLTFLRAVSLMVHKRLHSEEYPHACSEEGCEEKFVSKKLLMKHEFKHRQPIEEPKQEEELKVVDEVIKPPTEPVTEEDTDLKPKVTEEPEEEEKPVEKPKPKVDVYDLPELNLSESDSSDSEDEKQKINPEATKPESDSILQLPREGILKTEEATDAKPDTEDRPIPVLENVWDDFKNYQATIAKLDILTDVGKNPEPGEELPGILTDVPPPLTLEDALKDHDYFATTMDTLKEQDGLPGNQEPSADHDYCSANEQKEESKAVVNKVANHKANNKRASDSSTNSDSSSCTCGSNCSCSSASSSSSSSSDSSESDSSSEEGRRRQQVRRERRRQKKKKKESENAPVDVEAVTDNVPQMITPAETTIQESDLDTTETDTDEDFYDKQPQKLASKMIAEKREKLLQMAGIGPYINGSMIDSRPSTPNTIEEVKPKKKSKSKKKKKRKSAKHESRSGLNNVSNSYAVISPLTLTLPKHSPMSTPLYSPSFNNSMHSGLPQNTGHLSENDSNTRASKRRRVPNKFYGYSSDEEGEKVSPIPQQAFKIRKIELPTPKSPLVVPPLMIKTTPLVPPTVEPISIRISAKPGELKVQPLRLPFTKRNPPKLKLAKPPPLLPTSAPHERDTGTDTNSSTSEDECPPKVKEQPALYCYCRCPYDEVSEMIGCDSDDCAIEWFHFECVGIMVPPKGQWYCPDCRKKKQQRRDLLQAHVS